MLKCPLIPDNSYLTLINIIFLFTQHAALVCTSAFYFTFYSEQNIADSVKSKLVNEVLRCQKSEMIKFNLVIFELKPLTADFERRLCICQVILPYCV